MTAKSPHSTMRRDGGSDDERANRLLSNLKVQPSP